MIQEKFTPTTKQLEALAAAQGKTAGANGEALTSEEQSNVDRLLGSGPTKVHSVITDAGEQIPPAEQHDSYAGNVVCQQTDFEDK
jgi:hypothetical protein